MNIFPIRSVRIGRYKYIHNLRPDAWFTNHSDRHRKDGAGAFWDSWDAAAKKRPEAKAKVDAYYTRPPEEFFDLHDDPNELNNLIKDPSHALRIAKYKSELTKWTKSQGDELKPHREPYLRSKSIPTFKPKPRPKKKKKP
jgi:hypothetical protein